MDNSQFVALVAHAAIKSGVVLERIGLTMGQNGRWGATPSFPAKLVDAQPEGTAMLGSRLPDHLVATLTHCAKIKRTLYCVPDGLDVFKVYW